MQDYYNHPLAGARDLDSAMTKLWAFYKQYFAGLYILSLVLGLLSAVLSARLDLSAFQTTTDPEELLALMKDMVGPYSLIMAVSLVFGVLIHAWVLVRPLAQDNALVTALKRSLQVLIPYLIVVIVLGTAGVVLTGIGLVILVLPGFFAIFYMLTVGIFALPVTLTESRNAATVISRSFSLAHKNLWPNMGWVIVVALLMVVISLVIGGLIMLPFTGTFIRSLTDPEEASALLEMAKNPLYIVLSSLASALVTPVFPILAFILYFRNNTEQTSPVLTEEEENRVKVEDLYPKMPGRG
jgi:hypothetical protein